MTEAHGLQPVGFSVDAHLCESNISRGRYRAPDAVRLRPEVIDLLRRIFDTNRSEGEFRIDFWLGAFNVCTRLMEIGLGRVLRVPPLLLAEMTRGPMAKVAREQAVHT